MKTKIKIIFLTSFFISIIFCERVYPPPWPSNPQGHSNLEIKTERVFYYWKINETKYINGSLNNNTTNIYYSQLGDAFWGAPEQEPLLIADNSGGCIEKYDEKNKTWKRVKILCILAEGANFVKIDSSKQYSIEVLLSSKTGQGRFRIRIDYYDEENPNENSILYKDYSNVFEIR